MSILKVNTIQHANGTEAMTIDSSGNITTAGTLVSTDRPRVFAYDLDNTTQTGVTVIPVYTVTDYNVGSAYSTSTGLFTAPIAGTYAFSWAYLIQDLLDTANVDGGWVKNGSFYFGGSRYNAAERGYGGYVAERGSVMLYLEVGDTFAPRAGVYNDSSWAFYSGGTNWGYFSGALIG